MLNLSVSGFNMSSTGMTDTMMKETLIKQAHENPDSIIAGFTERGEDLIFIAKLVSAKILTNKIGNGYYDGQTFIALDLDTLIAFINDGVNSSIVGKWGKLLQ